MFVPIEFDYYQSYSQIVNEFSQGVQEGEQHAKDIQKYGSWNIELPDKGILILLFENVLTPFYIFQMFSWILWYADDYEIYASWILFTSIVSITIELYELRRNFKNLKKMAHYECDIVVKRISNSREINYKRTSSNELVPGDIILIPEGKKMPWDAIQLTGSSIVNEAMLTGESVPVIKNPLPKLDNELYDPEEAKSYTLFSGTEVIQNRTLGDQEVSGLVIRTNFNTLKGSLIKSILYPKPNRFSFHADSMKFIGVLAILALIGFVATLPISLRLCTTKEMIFKGLDLITVTVPPALPAAMSAGIVFAVGRLKRGNIYCIDPKRINVGGRVKTIVFDKTGTLTEDSLQFSNITLAKKDTFDHEIKDINSLHKKLNEDSSLELDNKEIQAKCLDWMVSWHAIAQVHNQLIGDPLDIEMFKATNWKISEEDQIGKKKIVELISFYYDEEVVTGKIIWDVFHQIIFLVTSIHLSVYWIHLN